MTKKDFTLEDLKRETRRVIEVGEQQLGFDGQSGAGPMKPEDRAQIEYQLAGNRALLAALEELERRRASDEPEEVPSCTCNPKVTQFSGPGPGQVTPVSREEGVTVEHESHCALRCQLNRNSAHD